MRDGEVTKAEQLDAKLAIRSMRNHGQLWRLAEGRFGWREAIALLVPIVLVTLGIVEIVRDEGLAAFMQQSRGGVQLVLGLALLVSVIWSHTQRQLNALQEVVKRLERSRH